MVRRQARKHLLSIAVAVAMSFMAKAEKAVHLPRRLAPVTDKHATVERDRRPILSLDAAGTYQTHAFRPVLGEKIRFAFGVWRCGAAKRNGTLKAPPKRGRLIGTAPRGFLPAGRAIFDVMVVSEAGAARLVHRIVEPRARSADLGWQEVDLDLSAYREHSVRLRFIAAGSGNAGRCGCFSVPRLVESGRGKPSVLLMSVDTLGARRMSLYGESRPTTPALDRYARQHAVIFNNASAQAPWTIPSHVSLFSSLGPGIAKLKSWPPDLKMLPEILRNTGYHTVAIVSYAILDPNTIFGRGYDRYVTGVGKLPDQVDLAMELLKRYRDEPLFLFFHTFEVHDPYGANGVHLFVDRPSPRIQRQKLKARLDPKALSRAERSQVIDYYDDGIRYTDSRLRPLLRYLGSGDFAPRGLFALFGDHGEEMAEHLRFGHRQTLYDELLHVPLILAVPGGRHRGETVGEQVRLLDLAPTILASMGIEPPASYQGTDLVARIAGSRRDRLDAVALTDVVAREGKGKDRSVRRISLVSIREGNSKLIMNLHGPAAHLFNLRSDPAEHRDILAGRPAPRKMVLTLARQVASGANGIQLWVVGDPASRWSVDVVSSLPIKSADTFFAASSAVLSASGKRVAIDLTAPHGVAGVVLDITIGATVTVTSPHRIQTPNGHKPNRGQLSFHVGDLVVPLGPEGISLPGPADGLYLLEVDRSRARKARPTAEHLRGLKALGYID